MSLNPEFQAVKERTKVICSGHLGSLKAYKVVRTYALCLTMVVYGYSILFPRTFTVELHSLQRNGKRNSYTKVIFGEMTFPSRRNPQDEEMQISGARGEKFQ